MSDSRIGPGLDLRFLRLDLSCVGRGVRRVVESYTDTQR